MRSHQSEQGVRAEGGFTIIEMMIASLITMVVMGIAFTTFRDALSLNESMIQLTDSGQNLRAGTNLLVRDLLQAGRNIPSGGIAIPSGVGSVAINRPSPPGTTMTFDNIDATSLTALSTGFQKGPAVDGRPTDMITILMDDPYLPSLGLYASNAPTTYPRVAADGSQFTVGSQTAWLTGNGDEAISPVKAGDLFYFDGAGNTAIQTVTKVTGGTVFFEASGDPFRFNQRGAEAGSVMETLPQTPYCAGPPACEKESPAAITIRRIFMLTYYVKEDEPGVPRLMRMMNFFTPQALAGVIEDLKFGFDLVDGSTNPVGVDELPFDSSVGGVAVTYTANQIRKVNVHVGVRSEKKSARTKDYVRNHVSTVVSIRNLAYVDRYE
jgi:hypothetical protein